MTSRIIRAVIDDDCRPSVPSATPALAYFRRVIEDAHLHPSPQAALAKTRLDYFCGHLDGVPGLRDFIPAAVVARHFSALHPAAAGDRVTFTRALGLYLSLLHADVRDGASGVEFRGVSVALTFDRARHEANILRFVDDGAVNSRQMRHEVPRGHSR